MVDQSPCVIVVGKEVVFEVFVSKAATGALSENVLHPLTKLDAMPLDTAILSSSRATRVLEIEQSTTVATLSLLIESIKHWMQKHLPSMRASKAEIGLEF